MKSQAYGSTGPMSWVLRGVAFLLPLLITSLAFAEGAPPAGEAHGSGEAALIVPDLASQMFAGGMNGRTLLIGGIGVCILGLVFGMAIYTQLKNAPVHKSMLEISELIYETCKTYLITQMKFILILEAFIGTIMVLYFGSSPRIARRPARLGQVAIILFFSLVGIAGSSAVAWFGIRVNTFANSRTAFAALEGKPFPCYAIPLKAGMSIGMLLISDRAHADARHPPLHPRRVRGPVLHRLRHRRVARRLGPPHRGRHLHEDRRHRVGPHEDRLQDQGRRRA